MRNDASVQGCVSATINASSGTVDVLYSLEYLVIFPKFEFILFAPTLNVVVE